MSSVNYSMDGLFMYLISFQYEHYCQGYEWCTETVLVLNANSLSEACDKIKLEFFNAKNFVNMTLDCKAI